MGARDAESVHTGHLADDVSERIKRMVRQLATKPVRRVRGRWEMIPEETETIIYICGHSGKVVRRCAAAYSRRFCDECALTQLPKPSDCLREFLKEHGNCNHFGPMLGPIGAVVYARQSYFGIDSRIAWSGLEDMHKALDGFEPTRHVTPYIERFVEQGL